MFHRTPAWKTNYQLFERVSELIVLLDVSILVGEQLFFSEIAFFDHCLQHL